MKYTFTLLCLILSSLISFPQDSLVRFSGSVIDQKTKAPLPYANIALKIRSIGTTTNENGEFEFKIPQAYLNDTIEINYLGYDVFEQPLSKLKKESTIKLKPSAFDLKEVIIRPKPPTYYIQIGLENIPENYPSEAFTGRSYYREWITENQNPISYKEAVFKSYFPAYSDTSVKNQHQVMLYREPDKLYEVALNKEKRDKQAAKEKRKAEKNGETIDTADAKMIATALSGPQAVLQTDIVHTREIFLDSNYFKKFIYTFGQPTTFQGREVMVIHFESKNKVEHTRQQGTLYLDANSYAFIKYHYDGVLVIPAYIKPVIFLAGYGIENPTFNRSIEYTFRNGNWYPYLIHTNIDFTLEKKHIFSANEVSDFNIQQGLLFNQLDLENHDEIPEEKRFDNSKPIKEQVFNDLNLNWRQINTIR